MLQMGALLTTWRARSGTLRARLFAPAPRHEIGRRSFPEGKEAATSALDVTSGFLNSKGETRGDHRPMNHDSSRDRSRPKRKVALHVGYIGTRFRGLQRVNDHAQAHAAADQLETVISEAICATGGISRENVSDLTKVGWSRSSRTDKGVHSLSTILGLKLQVSIERICFCFQSLHSGK